MSLLAALCAGMAAALLLRPRSFVPARGVADTGRATAGRAWLVAPPLLVALLVLAHGRQLALGVVVALAGAGCIGLWKRGRQRVAGDRRRILVVEACEALASELRAGQPPLPALEHAAVVWPPLATVAGVCRLDGDVPAALREVGALAGAEGMTDLAAAWEVAHRVGGGLALALDRVAETARGRLSTRHVINGELASAQATARMVALLPLVLLVISDGSGAEPWHFLLETTPGIACLGGGLGLALAGMWWIERIVTRAEG